LVNRQEWVLPKRAPILLKTLSYINIIQWKGDGAAMLRLQTHGGQVLTFLWIAPAKIQNDFDNKYFFLFFLGENACK
jgi:hypothetical protein